MSQSCGSELTTCGKHRKAESSFLHPSRPPCLYFITISSSSSSERHATHSESAVNRRFVDTTVLSRHPPLSTLFCADWICIFGMRRGRRGGEKGEVLHSQINLLGRLRMTLTSTPITGTLPPCLVLNVGTGPNMEVIPSDTGLLDPK